jgi:hypothetical protein
MTIQTTDLSHVLALTSNVGAGRADLTLRRGRIGGVVFHKAFKVTTSGPSACARDRDHHFTGSVFC